MTETAYVVGDLHLGAGADDPLEDFRDDELFAKTCERIAGPATTLILNGDIIDFAQIAPFDVPKPAHLLWPESASVEKLEAALTAHPRFFAGLAGLIAAGGRIRFLIGNHDLDMAWPRVQARLAEELGSPPAEQLSFTVGATVFHGVHVEHGHHFTPENCPRIPDQFVYEGPDGEPHLERVWGTDFMLRFYNQLEHDHPYADNVKPMLKVVWHGLRNRWIGARELIRLFVFLKRRGIPWKGIASAVLAPADAITPAAAAAAFADPEWKAAVLDRARADPGFEAELAAGLAELEPEEQRLAADPSQIETTAGGSGGEAGATLGVFREDRQLRAARDRLAGDGITHVVFGHTHEVIDGELEGRLFNYGTWLPSLDLKSPHVAAKIAADGLTLDMLKDQRLYRADRRLVRIDADPSYESKVRLVEPDEA